MPASVWTGNLVFGLVSIPVHLYRAARPERVRFRQLRRREPEPYYPGIHEVAKEPGRQAPERYAKTPEREPEIEEAGTMPAFEPVTRPAFDPARGAPVPRSEIVHGYEHDKDRFVVVEEDELRQLAPRTSREMEIREFVRFAEIDPVYLETSYYVAPAPGGEKGCSMLFAALRATGYAALAEVAMHRREHVVVVRTGRRGLLAHTLFYPDEVHAEEERPAEPALVSGKELELAELFVRALAAPFDPARYKDRYRERVEALLAGKIDAGEFAETRAAAPPAAAAPDILEALRRSLEAVRKPAATETAAPARSPRRRKR
jgi:DNA end-binding protein Ku